MQSIYAMHQNESDDLDAQERFLRNSIDIIQDLYLMLLSALVEIRRAEAEFLEVSSRKHLATAADRNPDRKFVDNRVLRALEESTSLTDALKERKINNWKLNDDYILLLLKEIKQSAIYTDYMERKKSSFADDRSFIIDLYEEVIAPNDKLYDYLEDHKLTWSDDIPVVNTNVVKQLRSMKEGVPFRVDPLFKDEDDREFIRDLFRRTVLNETELAKEYLDKTPNWDTDRIAEVDTIILKMGICEFLKFPSIPMKVTINEYVEIAKEYSTPKSSIFINGILDNLAKEFMESDRLNKAGRGLL
ncbi:MAG TPA: transcription antitermination factor NusB [Flavobacterium sp.]|nr:transcription antitermination factor NusB [Flavobacterium sp.]